MKLSHEDEAALLSPSELITASISISLRTGATIGSTSNARAADSNGAKLVMSRAEHCPRSTIDVSDFDSMN